MALVTLNDLLTEYLGPWGPALWFGVWGLMWLVGLIVTEW